jgi:HD-GYP domain-containing protein (c-di-GMP phosphodiesterase class II)
LGDVSNASRDQERLRAAEVIASVCLATDLAMSFPLEHGLRSTLVANRLCEVLDVDLDTSNQVYFASMLMYTGCTGEAALGPQILAGDRSEDLVPYLFGNTVERATSMLRTLPPPGSSRLGRAFETVRRLPRLIANSQEQQTALCEVAEMLSRRLGLASDISGLFVFLTERWDGRSVLKRAEGDEIPLAVRIVILARDVSFQRHIGGDEHALAVATQRAGHAFDPGLVEALLGHAEEVLAAGDGGGSVWERVMGAEPKPWAMLQGDEIDGALAAFGDFADLISPSLAGHSTGLAELVAAAAGNAGLSEDEIRTLRRAAHVHDVGRVAIEPAVWEKTAALDRDEYEQIRLHPYHTERVLSESPFLESLSQVARNHHERLDGSGYHRGVGGASLSTPARLLAVADTFQAMTERRPHRAAFDPQDAAEELARQAEAGLLDREMTGAVIDAAGQPVPEMDRPGNLTQRETEVIGLAARGLQTKQIATALGISPKTADTHIQSAYRKMGVSTRAAATLYAMEHGLVHSGEFPIPD